MRALGITGLLSLLCVGCAGPDTYAREAVRHDLKANRLAQLGDGEGAARERWLGESALQQAELRSERRGSWLWSDLTLR